MDGLVNHQQPKGYVRWLVTDRLLRAYYNKFNLPISELEVDFGHRDYPLPLFETRQYDRLQGKMLRERSIVFFGDLSLPIHPALSQLLRAQTEYSILSRFLTQAKTALQAEATNLSVVERKSLPSLTDLYTLSETENSHGSDHPILAPALLVILQLGQFIS